MQDVRTKWEFVKYRRRVDFAERLCRILYNGIGQYSLPLIYGQQHTYFTIMSLNDTWATRMLIDKFGHIVDFAMDCYPARGSGVVIGHIFDNIPCGH